MSTAITPPTPENVADMLTSGDNDYHDGNFWSPSLRANGNVIEIGITPLGEDEETDLPEVHFRAVVVEGDQTPIVLPRPSGSILPGEVPAGLVDVAEAAYTSDDAWYGDDGRMRHAVAAVLNMVFADPTALAVQAEAQTGGEVA